MFVYPFHSIRLAPIVTWTMPSLEAFIESLTRAQNKLINMGKLKGLKVHAFIVQDGSSHHYKKYKDKDKMKEHTNPKKEGYSKPFNDASGSKGGKGRKGEKCTYCHKGFHQESTFM
jgi:ABC-type Zn2+ transport system substrate-binding protein/surface adhesin